MRKITVLLAFTICCSTALSWEVVERNRIDFISVEQHEGERLDVYIECSRGIGSVRLEFAEPVQVDSLKLTLMYDSLTPFTFCEGMGFDFIGSRDAAVWAENHSMIGLSEEGSVTVPVQGGFTVLSAGWIDFYRE